MSLRSSARPRTPRHSISLAATALAAAVTLAGCGSSSAPAVTPARGRATSAGTVYPVTVSNCGTSATYTKAPTRAVSNDINTTEDMLALGLGPHMAGDFGVTGDGPAGKPVPHECLLAAAGSQDPDAVEIRVAASVTHLGLAARLLSPALAAAVLHGRLLAPDLRDIWWQPVMGGPIPMSVSLLALQEPGCSGLPTTPEGLASGVGSELLDGSLHQLSDSMSSFSLSPHILRGNIASAVNGATTMITAARPNLARHARTIASLILEQPQLRNAGTTTPAGAFVRRSCCLIYRAAPGRRGALCGDCVLSRPRTSPPSERRR